MRMLDSGPLSAQPQLHPANNPKALLTYCDSLLYNEKGQIDNGENIENGE